MKKRILQNGIQALAALAFMLSVWGIAYLVTGNELLGAFGVSFVFALFFALAAYMVPAFGRFFSPIVSVFRSLPVLAVLLILLVWWGAGFAPVAVAFMSLFPMLYAGISAALSAVDKELIEMSRVYGVPLKKRILQLYLPSASPYVLREAGAALSFSLKLVISAEVLANTYKSLGGMMQEARAYLEMPTLFALVIVGFLTGLFLELLVGVAAWAVERRVK